MLRECRISTTPHCVDCVQWSVAWPCAYRARVGPCGLSDCIVHSIFYRGHGHLSWRRRLQSLLLLLRGPTGNEISRPSRRLCPYEIRRLDEAHPRWRSPQNGHAAHLVLWHTTSASSSPPAMHQPWHAAGCLVAASAGASSMAFWAADACRAGAGAGASPFARAAVGAVWGAVESFGAGPQRSQLAHGHWPQLPMLHCSRGLEDRTSEHGSHQANPGFKILRGYPAQAVKAASAAGE